MAHFDSPFGLADAWCDKPRPVGFCLRCQERLRMHRPEPSQCHLCQWQFDPLRPETFRTDRMFLRWKFWFPGFCLAVSTGVLSYAAMFTSGELGWSLFGAVPVSFGTILGYATRLQTWLLTMLSIVAIFTVVSALVTLQYAGIFCGCTLGIIFLVPTTLGVLLGVTLRKMLKNSAWDQRMFLPLVMMAIVPYGCQLVELAIPNRVVVATVRTELTIDATPEEAWNAIMFYEDVAHEPPWLMRLVLPRPLRTAGDKSRVGGDVKCFYDRGYLSKRITRRDQPQLLAFDVTEQHLHFEHDVELRDGSFEIEPLPGGKSLIRLTTRYERKLAPRFVWEPIERHVLHTLHGHLLEGMRREAERRRQSPESQPNYRTDSPDTTDSPQVF